MQPLSANQITQIAELIVSKSPSEIATELNIPRRTIYRRLAKGSTKRLIEIIQKDFIHECLPSAAENITEVIQNDKKISNHQYLASQRVLESGGVLNTQAPSIYVQQIFQNNQITLSPILQGVIAGHLKGMDEVVEGEVEDVHTTDPHESMAPEAISDAHTGVCTGDTEIEGDHPEDEDR